MKEAGVSGTGQPPLFARNPLYRGVSELTERAKAPFFILHPARGEVCLKSTESIEINNIRLKVLTLSFPLFSPSKQYE